MKASHKSQPRAGNRFANTVPNGLRENENRLRQLTHG
jgi:hypothetical protein